MDQNHSISNQSFPFADYELIPEVVRRGPAISIRPDGQVTLNDCLLSEIRQYTQNLRFGFALHKQDKRRLILFFTDAPNYAFRSSGSKKDVRFSKSLVASGVSLPAKYTMAWNDALNGWMGELDRPLTENALAHSLTSRRRKRG